MNFKVIAGAGALVWMAAVVPAGAADIPSAPIVKAPVMVPATQSWYGFYIGGNAGYGWGRDSTTFTPDAFFLPLVLSSGIPLTNTGSSRGFVGGITYGSNYQFNSIVVGLDSDFDFSDIKRSATFNGAVAGIPFTNTTSQKLDWFSTTRVRAGFLIDPHWLLFAAGGLASGRAEASSNTTVNVAGGCLVPGNCPFGSVAKNLWGWTVGGGIEYASGPWQFRAEYLHYDLGNLTFTVRDPLLPFNVIGASTRFSGDIVRGSITYRFNWTLLGLLFGTDHL